MRIGLVAPPWLPVPPPGYGGIELVLDQLALGLQQAGHDVLLATTGDSTCPVPRVVTMPHCESRRMGAVAPELRHVLRAYEGLTGCDVIHDHTLAGPFLASRDDALRVVVTTNHGPFDGELGDLYRIIAKRTPVLAISHAQAGSAPDIPIARVIHHGVDVGGFPFGSGDGGYLLFLGRMSADKGPHRAALVAQQTGERLLIAAKMHERLEREYFEARVRPLLSQRIEYVGEVGGDAKLKLLAGARALVNPIRWSEPFGLAMVEALACGTPVLAFAEGAAPEIVDHGVTGFLCQDEAEMIAAVPRLAALERGACRDAVAARFSTGRMVDEHVKLYRELISADPLAGAG